MIFCLINLSGLWTVLLVQYRYLRQLEALQFTAAQMATQSAAHLPLRTSPTPTPTVIPTPVASQKPTLIPTPTPIPTPSPSPVPSPTPTTTKAAPASPAPLQEALVFLGNGSTTDTSWVDIPGASFTLNPNDYGQVVSLQLEASLSILGGEAQARLINKDTRALITAATVFNNTSTPTWKNSSNFEPFSGTATYMVQLRSTSGEKAVLDGARLRIRYRPQR